MAFHIKNPFLSTGNQAVKICDSVTSLEFQLSLVLEAGFVAFVGLQIPGKRSLGYGMSRNLPGCSKNHDIADPKLVSNISNLYI